MKIRRLRIRLSNAWLKLTFAIASVLISVMAHAQYDKDSIKSKLPKPVQLVFRGDSVGRADTISVDEKLKGRTAMYGSPVVFDTYEPLPGSTTIDETLQGTSGAPIYFNKRR